jgi:hypothetical protein
MVFLRESSVGLAWDFLSLIATGVSRKAITSSAYTGLYSDMVSGRFRVSA